MTAATAAPDVAGTFTHKALLHESDADYVAGALPFLHQGIEAGEACLVLTDPAHEALLRANLPNDAEDVEFGDPGDWYTSSPGAMLGTLDRCFADHERRGRGVRILGGVRWDGLDPMAQRAWQRYEAALNAAFVGRRGALLCAYDTRTLDDTVVATARCTHPAVNLAGTDHDSVDYLDAASFCAEYDLDHLPAPSTPVEAMSFDIYRLAATRSYVADRARSAGLDDQRLGDLVVAVSEVTANVVRHAGGHGRLRSWREDGYLVVEVIDDGGAALVPLAGWLPPHPGTTHGVGLWLARQLVDLVEIRHESGWRVRLYADVR